LLGKKGEIRTKYQIKHKAGRKKLHFRQWGGAETPCELKERMKIRVVSGLGEDVKVVRGVVVCDLK